MNGYWKWFCLNLFLRLCCVIYLIFGLFKTCCIHCCFLCRLFKSSFRMFSSSYSSFFSDLVIVGAWYLKTVFVDCFCNVYCCVWAYFLNSCLEFSIVHEIALIEVAWNTGRFDGEACMIKNFFDNLCEVCSLLCQLFSLLW